MRIDILTVFPEMVESAVNYSIVKRAKDRDLVQINVVNLRDFAFDRHRTTDDTPYGGGGGMIMKIEPIALALESVTAQASEGERPARVLLTDPRGTQFTQHLARELALESHIVILCGHYEGVDERVRQTLVTDEVSVGDFILTGGELPALIIVDAITRLQPGVLGDEDATLKDSFSEELLEYPHYTRPAQYRGATVPEILLCGHHAQIARWRRWRQLRATQERRPDLFAKLKLAEDDRKLLNEDEPQAPPLMKTHRDSTPEV